MNNEQWIFTVILLASMISCSGPASNPVTDTSWHFPSFVKQDSLNPILSPSSEARFNCPMRNASVNWEARNVLNPTAVTRNDTVFLLYRAQDEQMTSRLGLAWSTDGLEFHKLPEPVFCPERDSMQALEWPGGVEDPRIVETEDQGYLMTYTSYDGKTARLCFALSPDLVHWQKLGPVLSYEKYRDHWSKSGAIVVRQEGNQFVATKVGDKYWMYFGDTDLFMATSEDLIHWTALENPENGKLISVLNPRPGYFDSRLVEPGPFALLQEEGIVLIYNASNAAAHNDAGLPKFSYAAGQALYDKESPYRLIDRSNSYFIKPDKDYERVGEVNEVCFVEGLVWFKEKWFLYYGTADRNIAVAVGSEVF